MLTYQKWYVKSLKPGGASGPVGICLPGREQCKETKQPQRDFLRFIVRKRHAEFSFVNRFEFIDGFTA
jgi:hypothetical protein